MGIFKRDPEAGAQVQLDAANKKNEKARAMLTKKGFNLDGCLMFDNGFSDGAHEFLLIFADRIEYVNDGKLSVIGKRGKGVEVIPISKISSVSTKRTLLFEKVLITTSGQTIEFQSDHYFAPRLKAKILELMTPSDNSVEATSLNDPTAQLVKIAELHKAGVLTDEEFAEKKTELLKRI